MQSTVPALVRAVENLTVAIKASHRDPMIDVIATLRNQIQWLDSLDVTKISATEIRAALSVNLADLVVLLENRVAP